MWHAGEATATLFLVVICSCASRPVTQSADKAPDQLAEAAHFAHVNAAELRAGFAEVFEKDFEFIGDRFAFDKNGRPWWLVEIRPRRPGFFVVRHTCHVTKELVHPLVAHDASREYRLIIGAKGESRVLIRYQDRPVTYCPFACVGDSVVIPVPVRKGCVAHRFSSKSFDPEHAKASYEAWKWWKRQQAPGGDAHPLLLGLSENGIEIENEAQDSLKLLRSGGGGHPSPGSYTVFVHWTLRGLFKAVRPGAFNVSVAPRNQPKAQPTVLPVVIVAKQRPLSLLADRCDVVDTMAGKEERFDGGRLILREGDVLVWDLWHYVTGVPPEVASEMFRIFPRKRGAGKKQDHPALKQKHPALQIKKTAFAPTASTFGHTRPAEDKNEKPNQ